MSFVHGVIGELNNFLILDKYEKINQIDSYQSEGELEKEFIEDLENQGYTYRPDIRCHDDLIINLKDKIQKLNNCTFSENEWNKLLNQYLNSPSDGVVEKTRKIHDDYIYDLILDNGDVKNIYLIDKKNPNNNILEVVNQINQKGSYKNIYDVTILVNGLPLVHVELKSRGVSIRKAFNQIHRYSSESFNTERSLFKYIQIFVISNGTDTRYFANTTKRDKNSFDFTMNWAKLDNTAIKDLKDFTATFFQKSTILDILIKYSVFDASDTLLIMRPYQIAATERILWKIKSSYNNKKWGSTDAGGYVWHTTGSGKTLTSFKAAQLATQFDFIQKVFFVVDRKDLDYQTMKEYKKFSEDSVNGSTNTQGLKKNILSNDKKIIVTTIQKLNNLLKSEGNLSIYNENVVFILDEAHRSQFGEAQKNLKKRFKKYYQFGFTGTPIFPENSPDTQTTAGVFGKQLHTYVITDAIRDEKVLKFKVDYNDVRPEFRDMEKDVKESNAEKYNKALLHPDRIEKISKYIIDGFNKKTNRTMGNKGFNAMFAVANIEAAKHYYEKIKEIQKDSDKPLKVATIFSFNDNEERVAVGEIMDEALDTSGMSQTSKEFLEGVIGDYNKTFKSNFSIDGNSFQNYYSDLAKRVRNREVDLLIVVGMFLTGFDAPTLNTLYVDKNLRYHGLIQAFSRTNRIYSSTKTFGNIVCFRDLEENTIEALKLFGDKNTKNIVLEKRYEEYLGVGEGNDRGYIQVVEELNDKFPYPESIETEKDKKEFVKLFGEFLKFESKLRNYDEFHAISDWQKIDHHNKLEVEEIKQKHYLTDKQIENISITPYVAPRKIQDYKSFYNDTRDWLQIQKEGDGNGEGLSENWGDIVFEIELLKSQEINLDYILEMIFQENKEMPSKDELIEHVRPIIKSSIYYRAKEELIVRFIQETNLNNIIDSHQIIKMFFAFAQNEQKKKAMEIINEENLNEDKAKSFLLLSLKKGYVNNTGNSLRKTLPKMSPMDPSYRDKINRVYNKFKLFVEEFNGVGGKL